MTAVGRTVGIPTQCGRPAGHHYKTHSRARPTIRFLVPHAGVVNFGSSHPGGFNSVFADGSVHAIQYDIDPYVFDRLGDREDGQIVDMSQL